MEREGEFFFFFYSLARMKLKAVRKMRKCIDLVMKSCVERFLQEKKNLGGMCNAQVSAA